MLCKAINKSRGPLFIPTADMSDPKAVLDSCLTAFASELHTGQIEIIADKEFADAAEAQAKDTDTLLVKRDPPLILAPELTFAYTYDNVPVLVTG